MSKQDSYSLMYPVLIQNIKEIIAIETIIKNK